MRMSLLEMTQSILSSLNSDQVNSIGDTPESLQVANCIKDTYFNMLGRYDMPEHNQFFNLDPSDNPQFPTLMYRPDGVTRLEWIKYLDTNVLDGSEFQQDQFGSYSNQHATNVDLVDNGSNVGQGPIGPGYKHIEILPIEEFVRMNTQLNTVESDVQTYILEINENTTGSPSVFTFNYYNDKQPQYCCIIANYYIIFDSYDNTQDTTLQSAKTMCYGWVYPTFKMEDTFMPNLDAQQFPLLMNDAKALAFYEIKNQPHQKAEEEVSRQVVSLQKWKAIANKPSYFGELPNFGRSGPDFTGGGSLGWRLQ